VKKNMTDFDIIDIDNENIEEDTEMGSRNHSIVQTRLVVALSQDERFTPAVEMSLDISQIDLTKFPHLKVKEEVKPDVCLFSNKIGLSWPFDEIRMTEWPLLAIEVLSPRQGSQSILAKFQLYFEKEVKSCWLVDPTLMTVSIYSSLSNFNIFSTKKEKEAIDEILNIHLPLQAIFK
jgi:Uma2 family endonuclease